MAVMEEMLLHLPESSGLLEREDTGDHVDVHIAKLMQEAPVVDVNELGSRVLAIFEADENTEGIVVLKLGRAVGLIMRNSFYRTIGQQFGREVFLTRPVNRVMNKQPLIVTPGTDITQIGMLSMSRDQESLYDFILVEEQGRYLGVISIRRFMVELSKRREKQIRLLEKQKKTIKNLMDNAGQGFLSFGQDLIISNEYSLECVGIFGKEIGGLNVLDLFGSYLSEEEGETAAGVLKGLFHAKNSLETHVYISLLPGEIIVAEKSIHCAYKVIPQWEQTTVMVILTDITEKKALEQKMVEEKNNLKLVLKALACQSDIINGMEAFREFFAKTVPEILESDCAAPEKLSEIYRAVHTFKGDFGQFYLSHTAEHLHELEDRLSRLVDCADATTAAIEEIMGSVDSDRCLARDREIITEILGEGFFCQSQTFAVSLDRIIEIERRAAGAFSEEEQRAELLLLIKRLRCTNVKDILAPYQEYVQSLAERLEKGVEPLEIRGDDIFIDKTAYVRFCKSLVHVFRNIVDHGIEDMDSRSESGKPENGTIRLELKDLGDGFTLSIADDGKGIDPDLIRTKAVEKGIFSEEAVAGLSEKDVIEIIFMDRFSTKDEVSILSGRGVGMAAVRAEVESLGGSVEARSEVGKGTEFLFRLPYIVG